MTKLVAIYNCKGGVGKTTLALSLARSLTLLGKKVLLVDADSQCNCTQVALGNRAGPAMRECTVEKLFDAHANGHHLAVDRYYVPLPDWGFSLVPGSLTLAIRDVKHLFNREEEGRHWLTFRPLTAADMDFVIFDCAPSFTLTTMSALCTARYVIAPVMAREELSLIGILACTRLLAKLRTYIELENPKHQHPIAEIASIVVNGRDSRHVNDIVATRAAIRADKVLGEYSVSDGHLPRCSTLKSHSSFGRPVDDDAFWTQCKIIASDLLILP